jgi:FkbH-like protein
MKYMKWGQIIKRNKELGLTMSGPTKKIALLSNITVFQLKEILELTLREASVAVEIDVGNYDSILQDSERFVKYDVVIIFWELSNLLDGLNYKYNVLSDEKLDALINKVESEVRLTLKNLEETPLILFNRFTSMPYDFEILNDSKLQIVANRLNSALKTMVSRHQLVVDIEKIIALTGLEQSLDHRQFQISKSLYTKEFYINYAEQIKPAFLVSSGLVKKVLVLDCDNTLWGGVLGEDGEDGIEMSDLTVKGKSFREVQHLIKGLQLKGILLALCSKNNIEDVDNVLQHHPDMILKDIDFVAKKVNWNDKAKNLIELSLELNLGLDSFIFVDDSAFEIGLIRRELPEVQAVMVPKEASSYSSVIRDLEKYFFSLSSTGEDSKKTLMYNQEKGRADSAKNFESIDDYLASLGLSLTIDFNKDVCVARAAQLTQKTNQFNLRTTRYSEAEINSFVHRADRIVVSFSLSDRYGDYGTTGLCIVRLEKELAFLDTFLMSCRVIGRNVEYKFFSEIVNALKHMKLDEVSLEAEWVRTDKNRQVVQFYEHLGLLCKSESENSKSYTLPLSSYVPRILDYIVILN